MWGFEPKHIDMYLSDGADFIQKIQITSPETGLDYSPPAGARVFFRVGKEEWVGTLTGSTGVFKVQSVITDTIKRGTNVQFCLTVGDEDWVLTKGRVIRG